MQLRLASSGLTAQQRVMAGIAHLTKIDPDWRDKLNLGTLNIKYDCGCVIGQLYGSYNKNVGEGRLIPDHKKAADLGFYAYNHLNDGANAEYAVLTKTWVDVLAAEDAVRKLMQRVSGTARVARRAAA